MGTRIRHTNNRSSAFRFISSVLIAFTLFAGCARPTAVDDAPTDAAENVPFSDSRTRQYDSVSERELVELLSATDEPILVECGVDFNCARCDQMTPVVNDLGKRFAGQARIVRVRFNPSSGIQAGLRVCPSYLFFQDGRLVDRCDGPSRMPILQAKLSALVANDVRFESFDSQNTQHSEMSQ